MQTEDASPADVQAAQSIGGLPPSHKREYLKWVLEAKKTRDPRPPRPGHGGAAQELTRRIGSPAHESRPAGCNLSVECPVSSRKLAAMKRPERNIHAAALRRMRGRVENGRSGTAGERR
jgi:hypothetical protein